MHPRHRYHAGQCIDVRFLDRLDGGSENTGSASV